MNSLATWNRLNVPLCLLLLLTMAAGCSDRPTAGTGGQAVIAENVDMNTPHPIVSESNLDNEIISILYRPLLNPEWIDGRLIYQTAEESPLALARSYEFFGPDSASLRYSRW